MKDEKFNMKDTTDKRNSDSDDSTEEFEADGLLEEYSGRESPCFITVETEDGEIERIQVRAVEDDFSPPSSGAFFNSAGFKTKNIESQLEGGFIAAKTASIKKELKRASRRRIVAKNGNCNVQLYRVPRKKRQYVKDMFTTCVDMKWRYTMLAFTASFFISWLLFAIIWYIISYCHGDFEEDHLPDKQEESGWTPCISYILDFTSCFLFSVETQHTIGYGSRATTEECPEAVIFMCLQSIAGVIIQACMAGIVFAKLARPKQRSNTVMFSKNAVITQRNGDMYLLYRVGNMRSSHLLEAHVRAQIVHKVVTREGEIINFHQEEIKVGTQIDGGEDRALFIWPMTVSHKIDEDSPLWSLSPRELLSHKFEILVTLEGNVESTGSSVQARSSYLPNEILWGHRFENMISYAKHKGVYAVDCGSVNMVVPDELTPRISAKNLAEIKSGKVSNMRSMNNMRSMSISQLATLLPNKTISEISPRRKGRSMSIDQLGNLFPNKKISQTSQMSLLTSRIAKLTSVGDNKKFYAVRSQDIEEDTISIISNFRRHRFSIADQSKAKKEANQVQNGVLENNTEISRRHFLTADQSNANRFLQKKAANPVHNGVLEDDMEIKDFAYADQSNANRSIRKNAANPVHNGILEDDMEIQDFADADKFNSNRAIRKNAANPVQNGVLEDDMEIQDFANAVAEGGKMDQKCITHQ